VIGSIVLRVNHNIEIAHRLTLLPGKCQNIHGHSLLVTLRLNTEINSTGYALGTDGTPLEFGMIKKAFRGYLDSVWDHHLHLNDADPWAANLGLTANTQGRVIQHGRLPGLVTWPGDPSTENIARWIHEWASADFKTLQPMVDIRETGTNGVEYFG
jgi:6-pyruvoyl-tetrahydropterin synthase